MKKLVYLFAPIFTAAAAISTCLPTADGCAPVMREGKRVGIDAETALIMWDAKTQTEHFVRSAQFSTNAKDFGFLVPTPTEPTLSETEPVLFNRLKDFTRPKLRVVKKEESIFRWFNADHEPTDARAMPSGPPPVQVLQQTTVGSYDAAVLKASDADALSDWLKGNDYTTRPALTTWLQHYVENDWIITAFKLSQSAANRNYIFADPVRLTFKTEQPFYPYREPADMRGPNVPANNRKLNVFFVSNERYESTLGVDQPSPARTVFAKPATKELANSISNDCKLADGERFFGEQSWVTEFEDNSPQRNGIDELFFRPSKDQSMVEKPEIVRTRTVKNYYPNLPRSTMWLGLGLFLPAGWFAWRKLAN